MLKSCYWLRRCFVTVASGLLALFLLSSGVFAAVEPQVNLTALVYNSPDLLNYHQQVFADYEGLNPNVKITIIPGLIDNLMVIMAGGVQVDMVYEASARFTAPASAGLYSDLRPFINNIIALSLVQNILMRCGNLSGICWSNRRVRAS